MRQASLKLKSYANGVNIVDNSNLYHRMFNFALVSLGLLALVYVVILGNMVSNILQRRSSELQARTLSNEVRDLELSYLSQSNDIDLAYSHSLGFFETKAIFATRKSLGMQTTNTMFAPVLSLNTKANEI